MVVFDNFLEELAESVVTGENKVLTESKYSEDELPSRSSDDLTSDFGDSDSVSLSVSGGSAVVDVLRPGSSASSDGDDVRGVGVFFEDGDLALGTELVGITHTSNFDINITFTVEFDEA